MNADGRGELRQRGARRSPGRPTAEDRFINRSDGNSEVYVINADGSGLRNLTRSGLRRSCLVARRIAFVSSRDGNRSLRMTPTVAGSGT